MPCMSTMAHCRRHCRRRRSKRTRTVIFFHFLHNKIHCDGAKRFIRWATALHVCREENYISAAAASATHVCDSWLSSCVRRSRFNFIWTLSLVHTHTNHHFRLLCAFCINFQFVVVLAAVAIVVVLTIILNVCRCAVCVCARWDARDCLNRKQFACCAFLTWKATETNENAT